MTIYDSQKVQIGPVAHINTCGHCRDYARARADVLGPMLMARRAQTGESRVEIVNRYMTGVHERHLAGHPIHPGSTS